MSSSSDALPAGPSETTIDSDGPWARQDIISRILYWGTHLACLGLLVTEVTSGALALLGITFFARMFGITAGYHRYFAHRGYRTSRGFQTVLAVLACSSVQKGPLWWSGTHRIHHRESDRPGDPHSPREGFWYAHQGWIFDDRWGATPLEMIPDFAKYPELVWLNRWHLAPPLALGVLCFMVGGLPGLLYGFVLSTVLLWHATYSINSLAHVWGSVRYQTGDDSRNNPWLALITLGEGWHNNHHHFMASARQGFRWWEIDLTYYALRALAVVGLVWDLREPSASVVAER